MGRIFSIDYGTKRFGFALSDPMKIIASGLCTYERKGKNADIAEIQKIVNEKEVEEIIIGLPLNMNGSDSAMTVEARQFAELITEKVSVSVKLVDERLTTWESEKILIEEADMSREKRKGVKDMLSAAIILQSYLNSK